MNPELHSRIVEAAQGRSDLAIDRANYLTAWQLSLDGNLPGEQRREWAALAEAAGEKLAHKCLIALSVSGKPLSHAP